VRRYSKATVDALQEVAGAFDRACKKGDACLRGQGLDKHAADGGLAGSVRARDNGKSFSFGHRIAQMRHSLFMVPAQEKTGSVKAILEWIVFQSEKRPEHEPFPA
jgi:hypothetical protein